MDKITLREVDRDQTQKYWLKKDLKYLLSFNGDVTIAQSPRNVGKSYSAMELADDVLNSGRAVAWGRYNKIELDASISAFLETHPHVIKEKGNKNAIIYTDPETKGRIVFFTWNVSQNLKGMDIPFTYMICDEFVPERYTNKTRMDTEFADWNSVFLSLSRSYGTRAILISNNVYWQNPFFLGWGVPPFGKGKICIVDSEFTAEIEGKKFRTSRRIVVENVAMTIAMIERNLKQTALSFTSDADMQRYFDNCTKQEYTTIGKCPDMTTPLMSFGLMSDGYYMGIRDYDGKLYFSKNRPDTSKDTFVSEPQYIDFTKRHFRTTDYTKAFEAAFNNGLCVFDKPETLNAFLRWLRHMRMRI